MTSSSQRKAPRVQVNLDVTLQTVDGDVSCETRDASYQGVFIARRDPLPLRKLIRFRARLPDSDEQLQMLGLVAHTVSAAEAAERNRAPGMGIQLFSLGRETRRRWHQFIDDLYERDPRARQSIESSRRPDIQMRIPDEEMLHKFRTVDLPKGRVFVRTPEVQPEGTEVNCVITHPDDEVLSLQATVTNAVEGSVRDRGVELSLQLPDDTEELELFLGGEIPEAPQAPEPPAPPPETPDAESARDDDAEADDIDDQPAKADDAEPDDADNTEEENQQ